MAIQSQQETTPSASYGLACVKSVLDECAHGMHVLLLKSRCPLMGLGLSLSRISKSVLATIGLRLVQ